MDTTDDNPIKRELERRFAHAVELPTPGEGTEDDFEALLDAMDEWCDAELPLDSWQQHSGTVKTRAGPFQQFARFYFTQAADAERFRRHWQQVWASPDAPDE